MDDAPNSRATVWLIALLSLPLLVAVAVGGWLLLAASPGADGDNGARAPSLGSRGTDLADTPSPDVKEGDQVKPEEEAPDPEPEEIEPDSTEHEIDTLISALAHATRVGDRPGRQKAHHGLARCKPSELVNARLVLSIEAEQNAWVRIEFFRALHGQDAQRRQAMRAYDSRSDQFLGVNQQIRGGEVEEINLYVATLLPMLFEGIQRDERLMALVRNAINNETPEWMLLPLINQLLALHQKHQPDTDFRTDPMSAVAALKDDLRAMLERSTATEQVREVALWLWIVSLPEWTEALADIEQSVLRAYLPALVRGLPSRKPGDTAAADTGGPGQAWALANAEKISGLCKGMLNRGLEPDITRALIAAIAGRQLPGARELVEAGIARKDDYLGNWYTALGAMALGAADLQQLSAASNDPLPSVAQGAIEGLRVSPLGAADGELRRIVEQGGNVGVQSQALGALLDRSETRDQILEQYLDPARDPALRAVAVAFVPSTGIARLKQVVEDDPALRVRQAALTRLGDLKDTALEGWFHIIRHNDPSPVLRAQARRYAEELAELKRNRPR